MALCTPDSIVGYGCGGNGLEFFALSAGAALVTSAALLAGMYLWATFFRNQQMDAFVKTELYELFISAILVVMLGIAVAAMVNIKVSTIIPQALWPEDISSDTTIYAASGMYFEKVGNDMKDWLRVNYFINTYVDQVASVTPYTRPLGVGLVASPMAGLASPIKSLLYNMTVALSIAFIINSAQSLVYVFALQAFLKYYLPLGIFFRCFTPTRRLGGALIGVACAFLFVFPALITLSYSMFYNRDSGPLVSFGSVVQQYFFTDTSTGSFWGHFRDFYHSKFTDVGTSVTDIMAVGFGSIGELFQKLLGNILFVIMMFPITIVSMAFAIGFVIPAFNILIFTAVAKNLSKSFGDEIDVTSLTRLI
ncbi:hypothetical protein JXA56_02225 [Candidatus Micrarchaeota archaeon]|nr:hypothetical protein [Candidatus Micrarchaeota archaeon]